MDTLFTLKLETPAYTQKTILLSDDSSIDRKADRIIIDESLEL